MGYHNEARSLKYLINHSGQDIFTAFASLMRLTTAVFFALLLICCARTKDTNSVQADEGKAELIPDTSAVPVNGLYILENYLTNLAVDTSELEIVDYSCAVLVDPTEEQIRVMRAEYGEEDFYIVADDNSWYKGNATKLLDASVAIK